MDNKLNQACSCSQRGGGGGEWAVHTASSLFHNCFVWQRCFYLVVIKLTGFIECDVQTSQSRAGRLRQGLLNLPEGPLGLKWGGGAVEMAILCES